MYDSRHGPRYLPKQRLASRWEATERKRDMRMYRLTPKGKKQLELERRKWEQVVRGDGQGAQARLTRTVPNTSLDYRFYGYH